MISLIFEITVVEYKIIDIKNILDQGRRRMLSPIVDWHYKNTDNTENELFNSYPPQPK